MKAAGNHGQADSVHTTPSLNRSVIDLTADQVPHPAAIGLTAAMPALTRRRDPDRANCWFVYYGDVRVGAGKHSQVIGVNSQVTIRLFI